MPAKSTRRPARYSKKVPPKRTGSLGGATPPVLGGVTILIATAAILAFVLLGGGDDEEPTPTATAVAQAAPTDTEMPAGVLQVAPEAAGPPLTVLPTGSTYVLGPQRFGIGLVDENDEPVQVGRLELVFMTLSGTQGTVTEALPAPFLDYGLVEGHDHASGKGDHPTPAGPGVAAITEVFIARPTFTTLGSHGVIAKVTLPDGTVRAGQASFQVAADSPVPNVGEPAIASTTLTATMPEEAAYLCSATPRDDMHDISLDQALANGKPTVVLLATPACCATRTCSPSLETMQEMKRRYGSGANFIHIEFYPGEDPDVETAAPAVGEWQLPSEPWLFLIDGQGSIVERYEGGIGLTELDPAVAALTAQPAAAANGSGAGG